jgi:hypothetical protein
MALTKYSRSISQDFLNEIVDVNRLTKEITENSNITKALERIDKSGDNCDIWFKDALSSGEEIVLNGIVATHTGDVLYTDSLDFHGNRVVSTMAYSYAPEDTQIQGFLFPITGGVVNIFDVSIDRQILVQGGGFWCTSGTVGDHADFCVVDKDDTLGLFSLYGLQTGSDVLELSRWLKDWYLHPGLNNEYVEAKTAGIVYQGLYLRAIYTSVASSGSNNNTLAFRYLWYQE